MKIMKARVPELTIKINSSMIYLRLKGAEHGCSMNAVVQWVIPFHFMLKPYPLIHYPTQDPQGYHNLEGLGSKILFHRTCLYFII